MIDLKTQIFSIVFSFLYGVFFYIIVFLNSVILFNINKCVQICGTFLFMFDISLLYFLCIKIINNGVLHFYFFLCFLLGWWICYLVLDRLSKK